MPTDIDAEVPGIRYRHGLRSPITGRPLVQIDMDVVVQAVKSEDDWANESEVSFHDAVGHWIAKNLMLLCVVEVTKSQTDGDSLEATKIVHDEYSSRPFDKRQPYAGMLRYAGELFEVVLTGTSKSQYLIRNKDGTGYGRFFYHRQVNKPRRVPRDIWEHISFCNHKECHLDENSPGCPCVCHTDGRNIISVDVPLETLTGDSIDTLLKKWAMVVEMVSCFLTERAESNAYFFEAYLGQIAGIEAAYEWLAPECYDPTEWIFTGSLNTSMYHLLKYWVTF